MKGDKQIIERLNEALFLELGAVNQYWLHYRLLDEVRDIMDAYEDGSFDSGNSLPETLKQWLAKVMDVDVRLFADVSDAGLRKSGLSRA